LEYTKSTDSSYEIKLTSAISSTAWVYTQASVGDEVPLDVYTHFVGSGSKIRISIYNKSGRRLERMARYTQTISGRNMRYLIERRMRSTSRLNSGNTV